MQKQNQKLKLKKNKDQAFFSYYIIMICRPNMKVYDPNLTRKKRKKTKKRFFLRIIPFCY